MLLKDDLTKNTGELLVGTAKVDKIYLGDTLIYELLSLITEEYDEALLYDVNNIATEFTE